MTDALGGATGWALLPVAIAYAALAVAGVALTVIDVRTRRLPNRIVLPGYPVAIGLFALACALGAPWSSLVRALVAAALLFGFHLVLRALSRGGVGGGDVKLAGLVGLFLGWAGWTPLAVGVFAAFVLGGIVGLVLIATRRASRSTAIPFGPFLLAGTGIGILVGLLPT